MSFVLVQPELKWLQKPLLKYVMLWHSDASSHDFLHAARLEFLPGDCFM